MTDIDTDADTDTDLAVAHAAVDSGDFIAETTILVRGVVTATAVDPDSKLRDYTVEHAGGVVKLRSIPSHAGGSSGTAEVGDFVVAAGYRETLPRVDGVLVEIEVVEQPSFLMMPLAWVSPAAVGAFQLMLSVAAGLRIPALRAFLDACFTDADRFRAFFAAKASADCHHAFPGGLAVHTAEALEFVLGLPVAIFSNAESREVLMVGIMLHDYAKLESQYSGFVNHEVSDEMRLLALMGSEFQTLRKTEKSLAEFLLYLLEVRIRKAPTSTPEALILAAADQVSAAKSYSDKAFAMHPGWASTASVTLRHGTRRAYRAVLSRRSTPKAA